MRTWNRSKNGVSMMEYIVLFSAVMAGFLMSGQYILNGIQGQYRRAGEGIAQTRQHDPLRTRECLWDDRLKTWYSGKCFEHYIRYTPFQADNITNTTYCRSNIRPGKCGDVFFALRCPGTCKMATWKSICEPLCQSNPAP